MSNNNIKIELSEAFNSEDPKRAAAALICDHIMKVLFFYFEEDQENLDEDGAMDDFANYLWDITSSAVASIGLNVVGKDEAGRYVAILQPCESVKEFLISEDIGEDDHIFYEDFLEDIGPDSGFGIHDEKIVAI